MDPAKFGSRHSTACAPAGRRAPRCRPYVTKIVRVPTDLARPRRTQGSPQRDIREHDCVVHGNTLHGQSRLPEIIDQGMLRGDGLFVRILDGIALTIPVGTVPPSLFQCDLPSLHLKDGHTAGCVKQNEIGFAVALPAAAFGLPVHRVKDGPCIVEVTESSIDLPFGGRRLGRFLLWDKRRHSLYSETSVTRAEILVQ